MGFIVAVAQMNSMSGEVARNLEKAEKLVRAAASLGAKLVVLPETFSTGFDIGQDVLNFAEPIPGKTTDHISALCRELRVFFFASLIEREKDRCFNTGVFIGPDGQLVAKYRKVHLFHSEKQMFIEGYEPAIIETELGTFGLTICMDLLFPEYIRGLVLNGAEYILNTTNWLRWGPPDEWGWSHLQPRALACIRALENTVGLAMACQWGQEGAFTKFGYSCIVSPSGRILAGLEEGEGVVVHELSMDRVEEWRKIATYLKDRKAHVNLYRRLLENQ